MKNADIPQEKILELDVKPILLAGGEPLDTILENVEKIPHGGAMRLHTSFEPIPLYYLLQSKGLNYQVEKAFDADWVILFYRAG